MRNTFVLALVAALSLGVIAQAQQQAPRDDGYVSTYRPKSLPTSVDDKIKDDPAGRREAQKEQFGGDFTPEFMESLMTAANEQAAQYGPAGRGGIKAPAGGAWTNVGPYRSNWIQNGLRVNESDTGRVRNFLIHPTNADIVYVLKSSGGLWKTSNFSHPRPNWRAMSDTVFSTSGGKVAFGKNPETLYLGTGDPFDPGVGGFVYRSLDGGENWGPGFKIPAATVIYDVKVDTTGAQDVILVGSNGGLYKSTNGTTYTPVITGGGNWNLELTSAGWLAAVQSGPNVLFLRSTNQFTTFTLDFAAGGIAPAGRLTLAVGTPGDSVVYAFAATSGNVRQKDLYRSTNGGLTFTPIGLGQNVTTGTPPNQVTTWVGKFPVNPNEEQPNMDIMLGQAFYNQMVMVDPADPSRNTVYIGGQLSSAKSTDGGATWRLVSNWLAQFGLPYVHADHHAAAIATIKGKPILLFGGDGGLYTSDDGAETFSSQKNDGMSSYLIYALTGNPQHADDVLIGLQDNGSRWRVGPTGTYNQVLGGDGFGVGWSQAQDRISIATVYYSFIVRNRRNPANTQNKWEIGSDGIAELNNPNTSYFRTAIATPAASADPEGLTFFTRTQTKLYRTVDGADNWTSILNTTPILLRAGLHPIGISPDDLSHFGVLGNGGNAWFTADGGATFSQKVLTALVPGWPGFNATLAYADNQTLYVGNENAATSPLRVIKSTDGGNTWAAASAGLPDVPTTKLVVSPRDPSGRTLYVGTWIGVYETTNGGTSWHLYGSGLPVVNVSDVYMPPDGSYLRVSTFGRGVWEIKF